MARRKYKRLTLADVAAVPQYKEGDFTIVKLEGYIKHPQAQLNMELLRLEKGSREYNEKLSLLTTMENESKIRFDLSPNNKS